MELHAEDGIQVVLHRHDLPVRRPGGDTQAVRQGVRVRRQGVIPGHRSSLRQVPEQRAAGVKFHLGLFAVHQPPGVGNRPPAGGADGLVAQAHAQNRDTVAQGLYGFDDDARILRPAGAGGENNSFRGQGLDLRDGQLIVADNLDVRLNGPDKLIEIVGKTVVVVDQQNHKSASFRARSKASTTARALLTRS